MSVLKVAIVGAGPSGLCSARHLATLPQDVEFKVFEQGTQVGGTWIYTTDKDYSMGGDSKCSVHSSMYKNLRTNLAKEIMNFPDFPFSPSLPSYPSHRDVLKYLQQYAEHFDLLQYITFRARVEQVKPFSIASTTGHVLENGDITRSPENNEGVVAENTLGNTNWKVTWQDLGSGEKVTEVFQAVFVCNGHLFCPDCPYIPGLDLLPKEKVIHTHSYRKPEEFKNQKVLIIGAGQSGRDIALDLSGFCPDVFICNRGKPFTSKFPSNVHEMPSIVKLKEDATVEFSDSRSIQVDSVLVATGYRFSFPFLSKDLVQIECGGKRVMPLYKHTFNAHYPSLVFIGVNMTIIFPVLDYQVRWALCVVTGKKTLPTPKEMIHDAEEKFQKDLEKGCAPHRAGHYFGTGMFDLMEDWARLGDLPLLPPVYRKVYMDSRDRRTTDFMNYQRTNYSLVDDENWIAEVGEFR